MCTLVCVRVCVCVWVYEGGVSNVSGQTETQFKLLGGSRDTEDISGHLQLFCRKLFCSQPLLPFCMNTHMHKHIHKLNRSKMIPPPPPQHAPPQTRNFTCTKQAPGTSGYWILTMKLQRLHSNGGDEVRSWDGNHKLIPLTWQGARPWFPANTALPSSTKVRKTPREGNTRFIINSGSKESHNRDRTHTICLILFWCDYCMKRQLCNLHVWLRL